MTGSLFSVEEGERPVLGRRARCRQARLEQSPWRRGSHGRQTATTSGPGRVELARLRAPAAGLCDLPQKPVVRRFTLKWRRGRRTDGVRLDRENWKDTAQERAAVLKDRLTRIHGA